MRRRTLAVLVAVALLTGGCGSAPAADTPDAEPTTTTVFNGTDVMFLQMMLAHHEPAAKLLELGRTQATRADVKQVAGDLGQKQAEASRTISGWLTTWGQPLTSAAHPDAHAAHGGLPLLDETQLRELAATTGPDFDVAFLNVLIGHQHAAVELSRMEADGGSNPEARELARRTDEEVRALIQQLLRMVAG